MTTFSAHPLDASTAYRVSIGELLARLATDELRGLRETEARLRLTDDGPNELAAEKRVPPWRRFLSQFQDVLVILLLVATGVSAALWAFERNAALPYEAIAIFVVVLLNATMGFLQESRAEAAVVAVRAMFAVDASVIRGGERQSVPVADLVPGDVIIIEEGDTIPADGRLIESASLQTSEAALRRAEASNHADGDEAHDETDERPRDGHALRVQPRYSCRIVFEGISATPSVQGGASLAGNESARI